MKPQIALTPDQMHELQSLGLDCSDARMCCINFNGTYAYVGGEEAEAIKDCINGKFYVEISPAYTLEDILMKLPNTLEVGSPDSSDTMYYDLAIFPHWNSGLWCIKYKDRFGDLKSVTAKDIMKCVFEMLKWALQNHPDKIKRL